MQGKRKLKPFIDGNWWLIGPPPTNLDSLLPDLIEKSSGFGSDDAAILKEKNAPVDHHIFQNIDGTFHLWGCIRATKVGRILYHWQSESLFDSPWRCTGEFFRCDHNYGECLEDWSGEEWLQSPFFIQHNNCWYMFYGGHGTGNTASDNCEYDQPSMPAQMCLMTSKDGVSWTRHKNEAGYSRIFTGPGEVRDPCVIKIEDTWYCYYAGYSNGNRNNPGFFCRTSKNLITWSDSRLIHQDLQLAPGKWATECPHVIEKEGYFYLFRTEDYRKAVTHIFRSEDPLDFGIGDSIPKYLGTIQAAAPEIYIMPDGNEYISSNHNPDIGTQLSLLKWVDD